MKSWAIHNTSFWSRYWTRTTSNYPGSLSISRLNKARIWSKSKNRSRLHSITVASTAQAAWVFHRVTSMRIGRVLKSHQPTAHLTIWRSSQEAPIPTQQQSLIAIQGVGSRRALLRLVPTSGLKKDRSRKTIHKESPTARTNRMLYSQCIKT
jgi:hypothetical protein